MLSIHRRILIIGLTTAAVLALISLGHAGGDKGKSTKAQKIDPDALDKEAERVLRLVHKNAKYPIKNFDQLAKAMEGVHVKIGETKLESADLKKHLPASIFPIHNVDDLHIKMSHLRARVPHGTIRAASIKIPAGLKPPDGKDQPPPPKHASYHGVKKKTTTTATK